MEIIRAQRAVRNVYAVGSTWQREQGDPVWYMTPHNALTYAANGDIEQQVAITDDLYDRLRRSGCTCGKVQPDGTQYMWILYVSK